MILGESVNALTIHFDFAHGCLISLTPVSRTARRLRGGGLRPGRLAPWGGARTGLAPSLPSARLCAARSGRPRGGPSAKARGTAVSDTKPEPNQPTPATDASQPSKRDPARLRRPRGAVSRRRDWRERNQTAVSEIKPESNQATPCPHLSTGSKATRAKPAPAEPSRRRRDWRERNQTAVSEIKPESNQATPCPHLSTGSKATRAKPAPAEPSRAGETGVSETKQP